MFRLFSFLLLTFGFAVVFLSDGGLTEDSRRVKRSFDISEIPEYEILLWPTYVSKKKSSSDRNIQTQYSNATTVKPKRKKGSVRVTTEKPNGQGRVTVNPIPEVIVPITVKPVLQSATAKPNSQKTTTVPKKPSITAVTVKSPTTVKPQRVTVKPTQSTQNNKITSKPTTPNKIGQNIRNTTTPVLEVQVVQTSLEPIKATEKPELVTTAKPRPSGPCSCVLGVCTCCSGPLLGLLSQKACIKVVYTPEEFQFDYSLMLNNRVLYQNKVSGKNPRPACIGIPRFSRIRLCAKFSNIYFAGRNVHFCMGLEGKWDYEELFTLPFDCVRMGSQGFAIVKPEDGGGIAIPGGVDSIIEVGGDDIEEYDENVVRNLFYY